LKHIVYKYGGDQSDEMDFDAHGLLTFTTGDIVSRHGTSWRIESVDREQNNPSVPEFVAVSPLPTRAAGDWQSK
jgi:hypothetical protein